MKKEKKANYMGDVIKHDSKFFSPKTQKLYSDEPYMEDIGGTTADMATFDGKSNTPIVKRPIAGYTYLGEEAQSIISIEETNKTVSKTDDLRNQIKNTYEDKKVSGLDSNVAIGQVAVKFNCPPDYVKALVESNNLILDYQEEKEPINDIDRTEKELSKSLQESYMGEPGDKVVIQSTGIDNGTFPKEYHLINADNYSKVDMFFSSEEEAEKYADKKGLIIVDKFADDLEESSKKEQPYTGGAGPSEEQTIHNNKVLAQKLKKIGIPFVEDTEYAEEMWGSPDLLLKIINPKSKKPIYAGYDRWGYVVDGAGLTDDGVDQENLQVTLKYLAKLFNKPQISEDKNPPKINKKYTHFAVGKIDGKIVEGWETISDIESLKYYAKLDLKDRDLNPNDYKLLSKEALVRRGIDPFDYKNWNIHPGQVKEGQEINESQESDDDSVYINLQGSKINYLEDVLLVVDLNKLSKEYLENELGYDFEDIGDSPVFYKDKVIKALNKLSIQKLKTSDLEDVSVSRHPQYSLLEYKGNYYFVDSQGYDYPRYVSQLLNYKPAKQAKSITENYDEIEALEQELQNTTDSERKTEIAMKIKALEQGLNENKTNSQMKLNKKTNNITKKESYGVIGKKAITETDDEEDSDTENTDDSKKEKSKKKKDSKVEKGDKKTKESDEDDDCFTFKATGYEIETEGIEDYDAARNLAAKFLAPFKGAIDTPKGKYTIKFEELEPEEGEE